MLRSPWLAATLLAVISTLATTPLFALTVAVESHNGVPRITVDGKPVAARMFWGGRGTRPIQLTPQWQEHAFEFTAAGDATNGTMHFRFGQTPGSVLLDDIRVVDLDAGRDLIAPCDFESGPESFSRDWTFWPTGKANTVGSTEVLPDGDGKSLRVTLVAPVDGAWPDYHVYHQPRLAIVKGHRYRATFRAKADPARPLTVAFYRPGDSFIHLGGPDGPFESQVKLAAQAGVDFVSFPVHMPWPRPGEVADFSASDAQCEAVLLANPNALLVPRVGVEAPRWWREAHPDHQMQWEDGRRDHFTPASDPYRRDAAAHLAALVTHLEKRFGDHIAGYHPCGQNTGEWFYQDTWKAPLSGYSPADAAAWQRWLRERYKHDADLQKAWRNPAATIASAFAPTAQRRRATASAVLLDPSRDRVLIDWNQFQQEAMAECICDLAKAVRTASSGRKLVLFFYGYAFEFGLAQNGPAVSGHYALRRVLDCPDVDVLCAPISYTDRGLGGSAPCMSAAESVALAGKLWLNEDDTHTYLATENFPGNGEHVSTLELTNQLLLRNVAQESLRNMGTWWMDLGASGWFNDRGMWDQMRRLRVLDDTMLANPVRFSPEIAVVIDEGSMLHVANGGNALTIPAIYVVRRELGRSGAPYGQYLLDDVLAGKVHAKLYIMLNAWRLSADQRKQLKAATQGATVLWCYAPGYIDDRSSSLENMRDLTGFTMRAVSPESAAATPTDFARRAGLEREWGPGKAISPLFAAEAAGDAVLATYPDGSAAAALHKGPDGTSIFVGAPGLTSELIRFAARSAGVHLFTEVDCNVYANGSFVALHGSQDGPLELSVGGTGKIVDVLTGETLGTGPRVTLPIKRGETSILRYR